jgi:hypothetical protein
MAMVEEGVLWTTHHHQEGHDDHEECVVAWAQEVSGEGWAGQKHSKQRRRHLCCPPTTEEEHLTLCLLMLARGQHDDARAPRVPAPPQGHKCSVCGKRSPPTRPLAATSPATTAADGGASNPSRRVAYCATGLACGILVHFRCRR